MTSEPYFYEVKSTGADVVREWRFKWAAQGVYVSYAETVPVLRAGIPWAQCLDCVGTVFSMELEPLPGQWKLKPRDVKLELLPAEHLTRLRELIAERLAGGNTSDGPIALRQRLRSAHAAQPLRRTAHDTSPRSATGGGC